GGMPVNFFFFFQAEDGIRDRNVTGVQTCALPIWAPQRPQALAPNLPRLQFVALVVLVPAVLDRDPQPAPAVPTSARIALDCPAAVLCAASSAEPTPPYLLFSTSV